MRIQSTADSEDIGSHTMIPMNPYSQITGTPTMTGSHGGITMINSSRISADGDWGKALISTLHKVTKAYHYLI